MYCKILTEVTKTIANVLQDLYRSHKDNCRCIARSLQKSQRHSHTSQSTRMLCKFSTELTTNIIHRCFASSKQTSQRQSPMYCKILTEVTKTIADVLQDLYRSYKDNHQCIARPLQKSQRHNHTSQSTRMLCKFSTELTTIIIRRCFASSKQTSQRQSPMYCKILTDVTKTIADVLQDLYRSDKDNRHKSINENVLPVLNGSHEVITTRYRQWVCKIFTVINISQVFSSSSVNKIMLLQYSHIKCASFQKSSFWWKGFFEGTVKSSPM